MWDVLKEWGFEIILAIISTVTVGYIKWKNNKLIKEKEIAENNATIIANQKLDEKINTTIEVELEPIYQELEDLRKYCRENENLEKSHMTLIVASYRFRLIQLCKGFLSQGFITPAQMEQLSEFYKLYTGLGGNGQAKIYYDRALQLPLKIDNDET